MQQITTQLAYMPDDTKHISNGAYSCVVRNASEHTLTYYTNTRKRIQFLQDMGLTHDTPIHLDDGFMWGRFDYAVTVTKLVPYEQFTREQKIYWETELWFSNQAYWDMSEDEFMCYMDEHKDEFPILYPAFRWSYNVYGRLYRDLHDGNVLACPITGKIFAYDVINIDYAEGNERYVDSDSFNGTPHDSYYSSEDYYSSESDYESYYSSPEYTDDAINSNEPE